MSAPPRICVLIPVYNHPQTIARVVRQARERFPTIVVNDGSTDDTATIVRELEDITLVDLPTNQGKGEALKAGFRKALELGFTHAITMDADGQHNPAELDGFAQSCRKNPDALITGTRELKKEGAPFPRRFSNGLSNFWFRVETGIPLHDTQCGYRCYPLLPVTNLMTRAGRYAYELEVLVKAAWAGIPILAEPVSADYAEPTSRLSHFRNGLDMFQISRLHMRLSILSFCAPPLLRKVTASGEWHKLPRRHKLRELVRHFFTEHTESTGRISAAVGSGFFFGILPIWGFQMFAAAAFAHRFRLNKAIALSASNISFPLMAPFVLASGLWLGHYLLTGTWLEIDPRTSAEQIPKYFGEWVFGSVVLAFLAGALGTIGTWILCLLFRRNGNARAYD